MNIPQSILDGLFADIQEAYPSFDRNMYPVSPLDVGPELSCFLRNNGAIWILAAYSFLCRAITLEIGEEPFPIIPTLSELAIAGSQGFLKFFSERIYSDDVLNSRLSRSRTISTSPATSGSTCFSMLLAPPGDMFRHVVRDLESLARRTRILDYARIADRHLEIRHLIGEAENRSRYNAEYAVNATHNILANSHDLTGKERKELNRLLYKAAKTRGILPSSFYLQNVEQLGKHPFGCGNYGDVYKGRLGSQEVAIKVSRHLWDLKSKEKRYMDLCKEALIWKPLVHPNILPFLGICNKGFPSVGLVSPFMDNGDLLSYLRNTPNANKVDIIKQVCEGLDYLHSNEPEVIHGDLKCANILVDELGVPKISDFGLARVTNVASLTASTGIRGTLRWMAPELVHPDHYKSDGRFSDRTDIYAFGMTCLEIFTEKAPFYDSPDCEVMMMALRGDVLECARVRARGCPWLPKILEHCCSTEPGSRFCARDVLWNVLE